MNLKQRWKRFASLPAGERFQRRYQNRRRKGGSRLGGILMVGGGIALLAIGAFLMVVPGPGIPVAAAGGALIASEIKWAAKTLDHIEMKLRSVWQWLKKQRRRIARA